MSIEKSHPADLRAGDVIAGLPGTAEHARVVDQPYVVPVPVLGGWLVTFTAEWQDGSRFTVDLMSDHEYQVERHDQP